MYIATEDDRLWLQSVQCKLYARSQDNPDYRFEELWGLVTDPRNLRIAFNRVSRNRGARTAGIDRITVRRIVQQGAEEYLVAIRKELRSGSFHPSPVRRVLIPKAGKPGVFRPLGIPIVKDRTIQAAMKQIMEPIFEAGFYPTSYGFRPGRSVRGALAHLKTLLLPRGMKRWKTEEKPPFQWAVEGDIKGCFDNIGHHPLMVRVRRRIGDGKLNRLVLAFLKAGVMSETQFIRSDSGSPQGGILSPLLSNVALSIIDERYERQVWPRGGTSGSKRGRPTLPLTDPTLIARRASTNRASDKRRGLPVFMPIRYADDFVILVASSDNDPERSRLLAEQEKFALAEMLKAHMGLTLSPEKTLVTPVTSTLRFLGHHLRVRRHPDRRTLVPRLVIPKDRSQRLRRSIELIFDRSTITETLESRLKRMNPILRGWGNFYRHAWGAKRVFTGIDNYVWWTIKRWLHKKHPDTKMDQLASQYGWHKPRQKALRWRDGDTVPVPLAAIRVVRYSQGMDPGPHYASTSRESPVRNERRTPGSARGIRKPSGNTP
jgi:group II intron reverse transcriptase/maturase